MNRATEFSFARPEPIVKVNDLSVRFERDGVQTRAVNGVGFDLRRGEILSVIGESGSGKSVMLRTLLGLIPTYARVAGSVIIDGHDVMKLSPSKLGMLRSNLVSLVFQEPATAFDPVFTIGEQIAETIVRHKGVSHSNALAQAKKLLDLVAIPSAARRLRNYPHEMSGGMRQRAMIALALSCSPKVLLADEPTTALDATVQIQLLLLLRKLRSELDMSIIFVTHDMGVAAEISDRVAVMYAGRFVETGSVESVLVSPRHPYTRGLLECTVHGGMRGRPLRTIKGSPPDLRNLPRGCAFAPRCGIVEEICGTKEPNTTLVAMDQFVACYQVAQDVRNNRGKLPNAT
jgi:peptide/nickel transport system ATP-binding protein